MKCHQSLGCDRWEPRYLERWQEAYPAFDGLIRWGPGAVRMKLPESLGWTGGGLGGVKDGQPCVCNNENHRHLRCVENCGNQFTNWKEKMWHSPDEWNVGSWCSSTWKKAGELQKHERDELWRLITWLSLPTAPPPQDEWGIGSGNRMLSSPTCVDFWVAKINPCYQWPSKTRKTRGVA